MIIAVDFDGTITTGVYPSITGEQPGAGDAIRQLHENGHYIIIWTCRCGKPLIEAINWLLEHNIPFDKVNDHNPDNARQYGEGGNKIYADLYVDDKIVGGFPGWAKVLEEVTDMDMKSIVYP